jgi:hypothetical protein
MRYVQDLAPRWEVRPRWQSGARLVAAGVALLFGGCVYVLNRKGRRELPASNFSYSPID